MNYVHTLVMVLMSSLGTSAWAGASTSTGRSDQAVATQPAIDPGAPRAMAVGQSRPGRATASQPSPPTLGPDRHLRIDADRNGDLRAPVEPGLPLQATWLAATRHSATANDRPARVLHG